MMERTALKANQPPPSADPSDNASEYEQGKYTSQAMRSRKREKSLLSEIEITNPFSLY